MNRYLIHIQYLGFRFHGWQRQPGVKTVESMVCKTLKCVLGHSEFKVLGTSRTDAMVSATHSVFELFINQTLNSDAFLGKLNRNLPPDIRALDLEIVPPRFNVINSPRTKVYCYFFAFEERWHPFCAPFMAWIPEKLDIELMQEGALLFKGVHNFVRYCTKPSPGMVFNREIITSCIEENNMLCANFFPRRSWVYKVSAAGFMRHQVRLMMGQLIALGKGEITLEEIVQSLTGRDQIPLESIAPASGLMLNKVVFHE
ncbi:MAG: tRNA pseudouridine(38-40) synthase TruA [Desulfobacterales bacterium]|nr:MAG: tRNA pseudouridine(38-40) synthase TruA [Desulfobacterales bacterium]